ncbi:MAG: type II secretion system ATPase GspE [Deltaproteobacteria bacterium]|nr:type II secretion system ATPase GspE [Deltaproteobacteria bacterium]
MSDPNLPDATHDATLAEGPLPPPLPRRESGQYVGRPLGEILVERFGVPLGKLGEALDGQAQKKARLGELLIAAKVCTPEVVRQALGVQLDLPVQEVIDANGIPDGVLVRVPIGFAKTAHVLPLRMSDDGRVVAAMADPLDYAALEDLRMLLSTDVDVVICGAETIVSAINRAYDRATHHAEAAVAELEENQNLSDVAQSLEEPKDLLDAEGDEAPIIRLVNSLMSQAIKSRASDIHIEPFEREMQVRFRIDGDLYEIIKPPKRYQSTITARVKIMAGLNIAEKRLPQDGRIRIKVAGKDIDIRVSTIPTSHGERVVMRLLDRSSVLKELTDLGFSKRDFEAMHLLIKRPYGIILVTGPTGSGKTTTLYACLSKINSPDLNILTIEDPVEYQLQGIGQVHVNPKIDLTFANGLRSFLRQDPDVIMVGEIRDRETAEIAIQASLTGHLVMSTVHTNDAAGAITRLVDMQVEPFLVASSLVGVLAQRLVRVVCPDCRVAYQPTAEELFEVGIDMKKLDGPPTIFKKQGCSKCSNTGYVGRRGIYELMLLDDEIRQLILKNTDAGTIKRAAVRKGMTTLREDGARKVLAGLTTIQEVAMVTADDMG